MALAPDQPTCRLPGKAVRREADGYEALPFLAWSGTTVTAFGGVPTQPPRLRGDELRRPQRHEAHTQRIGLEVTHNGQSGAVHGEQLHAGLHR